MTPRRTPDPPSPTKTQAPGRAHSPIFNPPSAQGVATTAGLPVPLSAPPRKAAPQRPHVESRPSLKAPDLPPRRSASNTYYFMPFLHVIKATETEQCDP